MIEEKIKDLIKNALKSLNIEVEEILLEHPADLKMGDYSTNVAMSLAKKEKTNPKELAEKIVIEISKNIPKEIEKIEVKNGFINFYLSHEFFTKKIEEVLTNKNFGGNDILSNKKIMIEYTQPNPFKPFHIGHLMSNSIGESLSRLFEASGAKVIRANYQGDVGPHVAKAIYQILKDKKDIITVTTLDNSSTNEKAKYIGECYAKGNDAYENDENAKKEIDEINKKIYEKSDEEINKVYDWGRTITLEAFEEIYKELGTNFNYYFFESEMAPIGKKIVKENLDKAEGPESSRRIFEKSDGAIVFHAENYDLKLHTRVFINSQGLPTYETKELGLTETKFKKEDLDISVVITAQEQQDYMKVVTKALELIDPQNASKMKHIVHGMMRLTTGKMSSRKGNVITGESLIEDSKAEILKKIQDRDFTDEEKEMVASWVGVSALKYSILKQSIGGDIIYDFEKSISFEGDSGPYLQYAYARAKSIIEKASGEEIVPSFIDMPEEISEVEKLIYRFPEIVQHSVEDYEPHYIANYLIELSRAYNTFYGNTKIIDKDDATSPYKVAITEAFSVIVKNGLNLLGIQAPERM
ncbi:MAG: arginine--tRNA ligase [Candidatus Paceibacterota bacterium]|jgi:arginyl-tRNA synthetase